MLRFSKTDSLRPLLEKPTKKPLAASLDANTIAPENITAPEPIQPNPHPIPTTPAVLNGDIPKKMLKIKFKRPEAANSASM